MLTNINGLSAAILFHAQLLEKINLKNEFKIKKLTFLKKLFHWCNSRYKPSTLNVNYELDAT